MLLSAAVGLAPLEIQKRIVNQAIAGSLVAALAAYERLNEPWQELLDYYQQKEIAQVRYEQIVATCEASPSPAGEALANVDLEGPRAG